MADLNGIINVLKPAGMTSHDVVSRIRRLLKVKKVGHTGTLDPGVTGVLPICVGKATKIAQFLTEKKKGYRGELTLGVTTNTQDSFGETLEEKDASHLTADEIESAFNLFKGTIQQIPPMVSAVRHKGKKLYELAREGVVVERQPRSVEIYHCKVLEIKGIGGQHPQASFEVICSKGTYVRTLCFDIGTKLGVGAHMSALVRFQSGTFTLDEAHSLEKIDEWAQQAAIDKFLLPIEYGLKEMPSVEIQPILRDKVKNGNQIFMPGILKMTEGLKAEDQVRIYAEKSLLAIGKVKLDGPLQEGRQKILLQPVTVLI